MILDEKTFKSTYIATFLASYMAVRYDDECQRGGTLHKTPPVEDAQYQADCAWDHIKDVLGNV